MRESRLAGNVWGADRPALSGKKVERHHTIESHDCRRSGRDIGKRAAESRWRKTVLHVTLVSLAGNHNAAPRALPWPPKSKLRPFSGGRPPRGHDGLSQWGTQPIAAAPRFRRVWCRIDPQPDRLTLHALPTIRSHPLPMRGHAADEALFQSDPLHCNQLLDCRWPADSPTNRLAGPTGAGSVRHGRPSRHRHSDSAGGPKHQASTTTLGPGPRGHARARHAAARAVGRSGRRDRDNDKKGRQG